ncbi:hypothetical protein CEQ90_00940 [Lewinellaceae bacterium SD302]|nr:hypothetical protein CEQ90_00940 [Lewinellaceae bacterium SD302]
MTNQTKANLQKLNDELDAWSKELKNYSHEQLNRKAADGGWSAMQCIEHMMLSESGIMSYIKKKLSFSPELPGKGLTDIWKRMLLVGYLRSPVKFKAPQGIGTEYLPEESDLNAALTKWRAHREKMQADLLNIPSEYYNKRVFKHPLAGRVSIDTTMTFVLAHFRRHRRQAMRVLESK